jgi:hypothetical protein
VSLNIHWFPECSSAEHYTYPFTGGLAPNRFQKPLGMRRKPLKSNLSQNDQNVDLTVLGLRPIPLFMIRHVAIESSIDEKGMNLEVAQPL